MRGGRQALTEQVRTKLLDLWRSEEGFGRPIGCVTTSYTFDAELFEEQCLARFLSIQSNPNETAKAYLVEREEKLSQCFACVLVDRAHAAPNRSLRWNLLPITVPLGGVLHAKLTVLVWENCIRVLIGSANLTEPGYRKNQEVMAVLDFGSTGNPPPAMLIECVNFIERVQSYAPGSDNKDIGPHAALKVFLKTITTRARKLPAADKNDPDCALISLIPGRATVIEQLRGLWKGPAPNRARVLSPFYDPDDKVSQTAASFAGLLTTRGNRYLEFSAPGRKIGTKKEEIDLPEALKKSSHPSLKHTFSVVRQNVEIDGKEEYRALHAKSIWLERDSQALYMIGSSNFTAAGLGLHPRHNLELNIAYSIRDHASQFGKLCIQSWPLEDKLVDIDNVLFLAGMTDSSENSDAPVLPTSFGLALYCLDAAGGRLELEIGNNPPAVFQVYSKEGDDLIDSSSWASDGKHYLVVVPWESKRPPSSLEVRWQDEKLGECTANWIVNLADMSSLPPPDELGNLTLAELMEILTSARPLHEVVMGILARKDKKSSKGDSVEIEPHKKVDSSQFLLRRMRRVAQALEGMRERLKQPIGTIDALRWRLNGPIGPIALAKRISEEDPKGSAFMITEVATTLQGVEWQTIGSATDSNVRIEVEKTVRVLHGLASEAPAHSNLAKYVKASFKELLL